MTLRNEVREMRKTRYAVADTSTLQGLKKAERLKEAGWTIYSTGLFLIYFYKKG